MRIYVKDIPKDGPPIIETYLIESCRLGKTKAEKEFLSLVLRDKTGSVDAKRWDYNSQQNYQPGQFVKVEAEPGAYQGKPQLKIIRMFAVNESEIADFGEYIPSINRDRGEQLNELRALIVNHLSAPFATVVLEMANAYSNMLRDAPAAKKVHQAYLGGLVEHIINLIGLAVHVCNQYPSLDRDVMVSACVLHDLGKIRELTYVREINSSRRGRLVGHLGIGLQMFYEFAPLWWKDMSSTDSEANAIERRRWDNLEHVIASHHGMLEWGAITIPLSREALAFHCLDLLEAKMGIFDSLPTDGLDPIGFGPWHGPLGGHPFHSLLPALVPIQPASESVLPDSNPEEEAPF